MNANYKILYNVVYKKKSKLDKKVFFNFETRLNI